MAMLEGAGIALDNPSLRLAMKRLLPQYYEEQCRALQTLWGLSCTLS